MIILFQGPLLCLVNRYAFEQGLAFDKLYDFVIVKNFRSIYCMLFTVHDHSRKKSIML